MFFTKNGGIEMSKQIIVLAALVASVFSVSMAQGVKTEMHPAMSIGFSLALREIGTSP